MNSRGEAEHSKRYCSILMTETPSVDTPSLLEHFDFAYFRVKNSQKNLNQLYFFSKDQNMLTLLNEDDETLSLYDACIAHELQIPTVLDENDRAAISQILLAPTNQIERLVFSGGGAKGVVYPGVYTALCESGMFSNVKDIAGSSVGSITAAMVSVGIEPKTLQELMDVNFETLMGKRIGRVYGNPSGIRYFTKSGDALLNIIRQGIVKTIKRFFDTLSREQVETDYPELLPVYEKCQRDVDPTITFRDLRQLNQFFPNQFKSLTVTAVKTTKGDEAQLQIFNAELTPDVEIALACRASCSLPSILEPVSIKIGSRIETFVDGATYDNTPSEYFDGIDAAGNFIPNQKKQKTLIFFFGEKAVHRALHGPPGVEPYIPKLKTKITYHVGVKYLAQIDAPFDLMERKQENYRRVRDDYRLRTIQLCVAPIETRTFSLATKMSREMFAFGYLDTLTALTNNGLYDCSQLSPESAYQQIVSNFEQIYRAILLGAGTNPDRDPLMKRLTSSKDNALKAYQQIREAILSCKSSSNDYSVKIFALSRAVEFYRNTISAEDLFKETYQQSFKRSGFFSLSKIAGECIFQSSTLERTLAKQPMFGLFDKRVKQPTGHTRTELVFDSLKKMDKFNSAYQEHIAPKT